MFALICILLPAGISVFLYQKLIPQKKISIKKYGDIYIAFAAGINTLNFIIVKYLFENNGNLIVLLNESKVFMLKYLCLACAFAFLLPILCWIDRADNLRELLKLSEKKYEIFWHIIALLYTLPLLFFHFIRIFDNNFVGDEAYSIGLARMSLTEMFQATANDVHPPLYYMILMAARTLFGDYGWVYHTASLVPYVIVLLFIHTVIWKKFGKTPSFLLLTFTSVLPSTAVYHVEVRMYSLAAMFVLLAFYGFYLILEADQKEGYILFITASLGAAYTHYYAMMSVAFFYLGLLILMIREKITPGKLIITYSVTIIAYLPWLTMMITTFKRTAENFWMTNIPSFWKGMLYYFNAGKCYSGFMLTLTLLIVMVLIVKNLKQKKELAYDTIWLIWGIIAAVGTLVIGELICILIRPAFLTRYLYPVTIVMWLVLSVGITKLRKKRAISIILLVITLIAGIPESKELSQREYDLNQICNDTHKTMKELIGTEDVILTNGYHLAWTVLDYYMPKNRHEEITKDYTAFDANTTYWLVWTWDLNDEETAWLHQCGYEPVEIYHCGVLGDDNIVHIYQLINHS